MGLTRESSNVWIKVDESSITSPWTCYQLQKFKFYPRSRSSSLAILLSSTHLINTYQTVLSHQYGAIYIGTFWTRNYSIDFRIKHINIITQNQNSIYYSKLFRLRKCIELCSNLRCVQDSIVNFANLKLLTSCHTKNIDPSTTLSELGITHAFQDRLKYKSNVRGAYPFYRPAYV